jgi:hypothetical protein
MRRKEDLRDVGLLLYGFLSNVLGFARVQA